MNKEKIAYLALDTAYEKGIVVLFDNNSTLLSITLEEKMAHSKELCHAIKNTLEFCRGNSITIAGVFVGLGPGSFIGVRVALATALGFTFARNLPLMGFCSHRALASSTNEQEDFVIFMKASGDLGYFTEFNTISEATPTKVLSVDDLFASIKEGTTIFSDQIDALPIATKKLKLKTLLGPNAGGAMKAALYKMNMVGSFIDESDFIKPNYVKSPNVSLPKKSLSFAHRVG